MATECAWAMQRANARLKQNFYAGGFFTTNSAKLKLFNGPAQLFAPGLSSQLAQLGTNFEASITRRHQ